MIGSVLKYKYLIRYFSFLIIVILFIFQGNEAIKVHAIVLSFVSKTLCSLLLDVLQKTQTLNIYLPDIDISNLRAFVELIYSGSAIVSYMQLNEVKEVSFKLLIFLVTINYSICRFSW